MQGAKTSGAGDIFFLGFGSNRVNFNLTENQTWDIKRAANGEVNNHATVRLTGDLTGSGNLTKIGNGLLRIEAGSSAAYTGTVTLDNGLIQLNGTGQNDRLGPNALQWQNTGSTALTLAAGVGSEFSQDVVFSDTGSGAYTFNANGNGSGYSIEISGNLSGALNETLNFAAGNGVAKDDFAFRITGDNSSLSSTKAGGTGSSNNGVFQRTGHVVLDNANALGTGNNFNFGLGQNNSGAIGSTVGLYATNGNDVSGDIYVLENTAGGGSAAGRVALGLDGAGEVEFSGNLVLGAAGATTNRNVNNLHLTAGSGSRVNFSGQISDQSSAYELKTAVIVEGGGTVAFSNGDNTYGGTNTQAGFGGTSITEGTTLLVNGGEGTATSSGTGAGMVLVGYGSSTTTADTTSGSAIVTVGSTAGLVVGQSVSGTGIAAGSTIDRINTVTTPGGVINTIQLSKTATATGSGVTFDAAATTGVLGGTGRIRPGEANSIIVASGSIVAPGTIGTTGTLSFDGGGSTGSIATFASGATFTMDLNATTVTSDSLALINGAAGDFVFNGNVINFSITGALANSQSYTLFDGTADDQFSGLTLSGTTITSGLSFAGLGAGFQDSSYLSLSGGDIVLNVVAVPEPATGLLIGFGLFAALAWRRRRVS